MADSHRMDEDEENKGKVRCIYLFSLNWLPCAIWRLAHTNFSSLLSATLGCHQEKHMTRRHTPTDPQRSLAASYLRESLETNGFSEAWTAYMYVGQ